MAAAPKIATVRRQWDNALSKSCPLRLANLLRDGNIRPFFIGGNTYDEYYIGSNNDFKSNYCWPVG